MGVKEAFISQGREQGRKEGRKEERKKLHYDFVKNQLKQTRLSISMIASLTGVSEAFVRKVKRELTN